MSSGRSCGLGRCSTRLSSARSALLNGEPIEGTWFDRTKEWEARQRGEEFGVRQFAEPEVMNLSPSPCWRHLVEEQYRERIAELVEAIIAQAAARRAATGSEPLGAVEIIRQQPFFQPAKTKKSPAPLVHAAGKKVRTEIPLPFWGGPGDESKAARISR